MVVGQRNVTLNPAAVFAELDGEAVLLHLETGVYFGLNGVGTEIWKLIEKGHRVDRVLDLLYDEYEIDYGQLRVEVEEFLDRLVAAGLAALS